MNCFPSEMTHSLSNLSALTNDQIWGADDVDPGPDLLVPMGEPPCLQFEGLYLKLPPPGSGLGNRSPFLKPSNNQKRKLLLRLDSRRESIYFSDAPAP
jgi:hypothetical protein